jgi:hypothetical protein
LVVGCSEQIPDEVRAYRLMGVSSDGAVLLSRHGATYSTGTDQVSDYRELLERLLGLVLRSFPSTLRERARGALTRRWNRDWGVEAEDLVDHHGVDAGADASVFATRPSATSASPIEPSQPNIEADGSFAPEYAVIAEQPSRAYG